MSPHPDSNSSSFFPRCSGLCLFVTVYISLFVIAGVLLFGSLFQFRGNRSVSGRRSFVSPEYSGGSSHQVKSSSSSGYYYQHDIDDYQWENELYTNKSKKSTEDIHGDVPPLYIDKVTSSSGGLRWPYSHSALINCSSLQEVTDLEFIASGWTKAVYKGKFRGREVAIKTVNLNGHDIQECQKRPGATLPVCYRRAAAKILKEIILLTELAHDNIVKVLGSCVPDAVGPVAMVTELGDPLDTVRLLQLSWEDRLRLALGIAQILHHLAHSPLGSLSMNDFRRQQFVLVGGTLKLSDVDDLGVSEPECESDMECNNSSSELNHTSSGLSCVKSRCQGHNERLNIWHAGQHFIRLFLPLSAPASLEPHIQELLAAYAYMGGGWNTVQILSATHRLVNHFVSGDYIPSNSSPGIINLGFEKFADSDLPGMFDYRCHHSISAVGCVMSVFNEEEAAELCARDQHCKAVVLGQEHTWTGRTLAVFKNGYSSPAMKKGYSLLLKRRTS